MTLSRLELGFESPWGRQSTETAETVEYRNCRESPKIKGSRFFYCLYLVPERRAPSQLKNARPGL